MNNWLLSNVAIYILGVVVLAFGAGTLAALQGFRNRCLIRERISDNDLRATVWRLVKYSFWTCAVIMITIVAGSTPQSGRTLELFAFLGLTALIAPLVFSLLVFAIQLFALRAQLQQPVKGGSKGSDRFSTDPASSR